MPSAGTALARACVMRMRRTDERSSTTLTWRRVAEGNCVAARRGGEQPEANLPSQTRPPRRVNPIRPARFAFFASFVANTPSPASITRHRLDRHKDRKARKGAARCCGPDAPLPALAAPTTQRPFPAPRPSRWEPRRRAGAAPWTRPSVGQNTSVAMPASPPPEPRGDDPSPTTQNIKPLSNLPLTFP